MKTGAAGRGAALKRLLLGQPFLPHQAGARRVGQQPDRPPGRKLFRESRQELRAFDDRGNLAQLTVQDVVEYEFQPEPVGGLEGIYGGFGSRASCSSNESPAGRLAW